MSPSSAAIKDRAVWRVVVVTLVLNLVVAAVKGVYAAWSGSLAVATDAVHSVLDASSNIVGLVALRAASHPPDAGHPYGHRKIEILAAAGIGVVIGAATFQFAWGAVSALVRRGDGPATPAVGFVVVGVTLVVNVFVAVYEHRRGRALGSHFLIADAAHTASDVVVTLAVLASLFAARAGLWWADPVAALVVTLVIGRVAWHILRDNLGVLLDRAALDADAVRAEVLAVPGVVGCHRVRSRGLAGHTLLDLHVHVDGGMTLADAHAISHAVEARLKAKFAGLRDVTIHVEPEGDDEEGEGDEA